MCASEATAWHGGPSASCSERILEQIQNKLFWICFVEIVVVPQKVVAVVLMAELSFDVFAIACGNRAPAPAPAAAPIAAPESLGFADETGGATK